MLVYEVEQTEIGFDLFFFLLSNGSLTPAFVVHVMSFMDDVIYELEAF